MSRLTTARTKNGRRPAREREGAAMLVVMLLLMIVTATATFAMHTTSVELRSTGHSRQRMQTRYVAEAALTSSMTMLEQSGSPDALAHSLERSRLGGGATVRQLAPDEPHMAASQANHRIQLSEFISTPGVGMPFETTPGQESLGVGMGYVPDFAVDVNDDYTFTGVTAGHRSDGGGTLAYLAATYTARGRTVLPGDVDQYSPTYAPGTPAHLRRGYHETAVNARAIGVSGPMPRR
ncbi:MAG: hypothetical protein M3Y87_04865 [Myxococcota bacterium]|nr:hypothetical protein [Myxococcota bacterium]